MHSPLGDHPRIRGAYISEVTPGTLTAGSPPHTRGILPVLESRQDPAGITPAYAGHTTTSSFCHSRARDHPRIRGAYRILSGCSIATGGSPPHTRGIRYVSKKHSAGKGITPAYAGHTLAECANNIRHRDHPRIRGAYFLLRQVDSQIEGSPPHTRGIPPQPCQPCPRCGITPAYAGHTAYKPHPLSSHGDHPRIRGAYSKKVWIKGFMLGSPPHTRGIQPTS